MPVADLLTAARLAFPERPAIITGGQRYSYAELDDDAKRCAHVLRNLGVQRGDRVAYLLRNRYELIVVWHATQKIGAVALPLNPRLSCTELANHLRVADARHFLVEKQYDDVARHIDDDYRIETILLLDYDAEFDRGELANTGQWAGRAHSFRSLMAAAPTSEITDPLIGERDGSLLLFTSGTTGNPKGVVRSQRAVRDYALTNAIENENASTHEVLVTHCPMYHTAGMGLLMKILALSGTLVMIDGFDAEEILDCIESERATQVFLLPPVMYSRLLEEAPNRERDLSSVREVQSSAGASTVTTAGWMNEIFPGARIRYSWGATETCAPTSGAITYEQILERPELATTIGTRNAMSAIRIVDPSGADVPVGGQGEALVKSSMVFDEYLNEPELTQEAFSDGWFRTGDVLRLTEDGYYFMEDRVKDMIKTGGENVFALEVERAILTLPGVADCAVIGIDDPEFGEAVGAAVVVSPNQDLSVADIVRHSRRTLDSFKKPRYIAFVESLPRNSVGKVQKHILKRNASDVFTKIDFHSFADTPA